MTHDNGFAPNPYHGILTLACCKPMVRRMAEIGDYLLGIGSKLMDYKEPRLIYFARITEKLSRKEYWNKYKIKRYRGVNMCGDNIYEYDEEIKDFKDPPVGAHHTGEEKDHDLGEAPNRIKHWVLVSEEFYYFGKNAPTIPDRFNPLLAQGRGHKNILDLKVINDLEAFVKIAAEGKTGLIGEPHDKISNASCRH